ncbi:MAG: hypothetical protein WDZ76_12400 [Pseudohongiellaceae bacterium]
MYLPQSILTLLAAIYLLFLLSVDWINHPDGAWYRPFVLGFLVVLFAIWVHREQDSDEL